MSVGCLFCLLALLLHVLEPARRWIEPLRLPDSGPIGTEEASCIGSPFLGNRLL